MKLYLVGAFGAGVLVSGEHPNAFKIMPGHTKFNWTEPGSVHDHPYLDADSLPKSFDWRNIKGKSYVTKSLNQHIPQYCGSCWAHGAMSSLADRIKIARKGQGEDINLAIQYILNCGTNIAGSCHGGSHTGAFEFVKEKGHIPYDTCLQYEACSAESKEGKCAYGDYECTPMNICRTCSTFKSMGGFCSGIKRYPNATVKEYGTLLGKEAVKKEIYARGPVACGVNAGPIEDYKGGIVDMPYKARIVDHIVSTVGWGYDEKTDTEYWIVRNSWGEYWGELGYFRIKMGHNQLGIENSCAWATPGTFTELNYPCDEDGGNCVKEVTYQDPHHFEVPYAEIM
mmetsp:Transcript_15192/g.24672  ORF Transcript_15192/g.24672 Transcript_15192/m.24672 type:complete len:340 (-) Transcript_15192:55-1074(-)